MMHHEDHGTAAPKVKRPMRKEIRKTLSKVLHVARGGLAFPGIVITCKN
jgi:hypothetical protein